jgi:hypothetical protein
MKQTKAKGICVTTFGTKWNAYFYSSKNFEQNPSKRNFFVRISEQNRTFCFVPNNPRKGNSSALKKDKC